MKSHLDIPYIIPENPQQKIDIYTPDASDFSKVIWFHGGGIESGSRKGDDIPKSLLKKV